jgi:hypothetical protein
MTRIGERGVRNNVGGIARGGGISYSEIRVDRVQSVPDEIGKRLRQASLTRGVERELREESLASWLGEKRVFEGSVVDGEEIVDG